MTERPPILGPGDMELHLIAHDEVCFHVNDLAKREWIADGKQPLRQKGRGRIIHVSDFIIERTGRLCLNESEREAQMKLPCAPDTTSASPEGVQSTSAVGTSLDATPETSTTSKAEKSKKGTKER